MRNRVIASAAVAALAIMGITRQVSAEDIPPQHIVDQNGNMKVPADYRSNFQYLGAWAVAAEDESGSKEMHIVYASPGVVLQYRATGRFPDGAVLVKEVYEASTQEMTTGTVSHEGILKGWFVMVKDSKNSYPDNRLWGDGWGWSWFDAKDPTKTTSTDYSNDCLSCHVPAQSTDWIYTQGYPPLAR